MKQGSAGKLLMIAGALLGVLILTLPAVPPLFAQEDEEEDEWPREIKAKKGTVLIYQPQVESFKGNELASRAAVSVTPKGEPEPIFGVMWGTARVDTDRETRTVDILDIKVTRVKFPGATDEQQQQLADLVEKEVPKWDMVISLDRLLTSLDLVEKEKLAAEGLKTEPPRIVYVNYPTILITIDGSPELKQVENTDLMKVVNTPFLIALDTRSKTYYLDGGEIWYAASDVMGPWEVTRSPPVDVVALRPPEPPPDEQDQEAPPDGEDGEEAEPKDIRIPKILVVTEPTELLISDGEPKWTPLSGTDLLYLSNTENAVLKDLGTKQNYYVISGRWYTSASLAGPWTYIASDKLPETFQKISPESDMGSVLAFVSGTKEAEEAVLDNQIPQTSAIKRSEASLVVTYDGKPKFEKIDDTDLKYAVNTSFAVIKFKKYYYACHQAVWYVSDDPLGPWKVADEIPKEIYTIPPSCPIYNVKYVYIFDSTPEVVYVGYYPGYTGSYVYGTTIVYGTGYYYPGWYGTVYYPRPVTWGFHLHYSPWYGWGFGISWSNGPFRITIGVGGWHGGWWGPRGYRGGYHRGYRHGYYHGRRAGYRAGYRAGHHNANRNNNIYRNQNNNHRNAARPSTADHNRAGNAANHKNNVYADKNGNVHKRNNDGSWSSREGNQWKQSDTPGKGSGQAGDRSAGDQNRPATNQASPSGGDRGQGSADRGGSSANRGQSQGYSNRGSQPSTRQSGGGSGGSSLNRDYQSRQRGNQRSQSYNRSRGGGSRGGGRRR